MLSVDETLHLREMLLARIFVTIVKSSFVSLSCLIFLLFLVSAAFFAIFFICWKPFLCDFVTVFFRSTCNKKFCSGQENVTSCFCCNLLNLRFFIFVGG